jgi:starch phosphorylase
VSAEGIAGWRRAIALSWSGVRFGEVKIASDKGSHQFEAQVYLNGLAPEAVTVELYAEGIGGRPSVREEMHPVRQLAGTQQAFVYTAQVSASRPASQFTARVVPKHADAAIPLEAPEVLWQH